MRQDNTGQVKIRQPSRRKIGRGNRASELYKKAMETARKKSEEDVWKT
jgi:hypothetical protein